MVETVYARPEAMEYYAAAGRADYQAEGGEMRDDKAKTVAEIATQIGFNAELVALYSKIGKALGTEFDAIDSGMGRGVLDYHIRFGDMEYHIAVKPSRSLSESGRH